MSEQTLEVNTEQTTAPAQEDSKNDTTQGTDHQPVYTKEQFNAAMKSARLQGVESVAKKYANVDVEKYQTFLAQEEQQKINQAKEKSEFEKLLKDNADKFNNKISTLTSELTKIKVDGALINAASTNRAINPEQVATLVRNNVKMTESGEVEVIDPKTGQTRYTDNGDPMNIDGLVQEFLQTNPHFVTAGQPGGGSKSNTGTTGVSKVDVNKLDMTNPEHRKQYAEWRKGQPGY